MELNFEKNQNEYLLILHISICEELNIVSLGNGF